MKIKKIDNYSKPGIPDKREFLTANNLLSVISIGLITITVGCSTNVQIIDQDKEFADTLSVNYPNPFMPTTSVKYKVDDQSMQPVFVNIAIHNINGKLVRTLFDGFQESGEYNIVWDSKDNNGEHVDSGVYYYRIIIDEREVEVKKIILLK